jgi:restriction system protein
MARRAGFLAALERAAREAARQQRMAEAVRQRQIREQLRCQREQIKQRAQMDRAERQQYAANRAASAEEQTAEVAEIMTALRDVLRSTLTVNDTINLDSLRSQETTTPFEVPVELRTSKPLPKKEDFFLTVRPVTFFERLFSRRERYQRESRDAEARYNEAHARYSAGEQERVQEIAELEAQHEAKNQKLLAESRQRNADVEELKQAYQVGESHAVITYCSMVLEKSRYPDGFPQAFRLAYVPDSKQLVIEYELPTSEIVPRAAEFRYVKTKDAIEEKHRKPADAKETYQDVVAAVALRTIHEVFEADQGNHISVVVFSGFVRTVDPSTGKDIKPYLISVRTTRETFAEIDLARVDKKACLRNLGAQVSPQPAELQPVKPLIEFDMVDKRFVEAADLLVDLESRPNLMDLTPFEFEQLVGNLFAKMGLESKQTRSSRDGGVDVVAYDTRPLIGGKVVIQAKRYRHTVGVSAVRDLFGTMNHEGANKGILVTTSSYGIDAYNFIKGKPIELIDGGGLLYYLEQNAGVKARIVFPIEEIS